MSDPITPRNPTREELDAMELCGLDVSAFESTGKFFELGRPPQVFEVVAMNNGNGDPSGLVIPVEPINIPDETYILGEDNCIDLEAQIRNPGSDPPDPNTLFSERLSRQIEFWKSINAPAVVIKAIEEGVDIGLVDNVDELLPPGGINRRNRKWSADEIVAVRNLVRELTVRGITGQRSTRAKVNCGIMLVLKPNGKYRFIWNGKSLSPFLKKTDFSYEQLNKFLDGIADGSYLGKLDLVDGFFALKVKPSQREYLGFTIIGEDGNEEYYEFLVLPQGITTAPQLFSRFTLAITTHLRRTLPRVHFITYLDDLGWAINPSASLRDQQLIMDYIRNTFVSAGWILSDTKSVFALGTTDLVLLGFRIVTTPVLRVDLSPARREKLSALLLIATSTTEMSPRSLMQIAGGIQSGMLCLGPSVTLHLRYGYADISNAIGNGSDLKIWDCLRPITPGMKEEFGYWSARFRSDTSVVYNTPPWIIPMSQFDFDGYTDSGGNAVGSVAMPFAGENFVEPAYWYDRSIPHAAQILAEFGHSIDKAFRELRGLTRMCLVHLHEWTNRCIRIFVDNAALAKIMIRGSRIPYLHSHVCKIVATLALHNIRVKVIWIPREENRGADKMSKTIVQERLDQEDYTLHPDTFRRLIKLYGPFLIDMFANAINTKCPVFVSRHADIGSTPNTIDAFFQSYWGKAFYAFPPVDDAPQALLHILSQPSARGILILPLWIRLTSFTRLLPDGCHFIPQVRGWCLLSASDFQKGPYGHASFLDPNRGGHRAPFVALLINTALDSPLEYSPGVFCYKKHFGSSDRCLFCSP